MAIGDTLIGVLDALIRALELAVNVIYRGVDALIEVIDRVARRIANLIYNGLRLLFYIFPFLSMVIIGNWERKDWLWYVGILFLSLTGILFVRELLAQLMGTKAKIDIEDWKRQRAFAMVLILNLLVVAYYVMKFQYEISTLWRSFQRSIM